VSEEYDRDAASAQVIAFVDRKESEPLCASCGHASLAHNGACYHEDCWDMRGGPFKCLRHVPAVAGSKDTKGPP
jgi:hypothetical protein